MSILRRPAHVYPGLGKNPARGGPLNTANPITFLSEANSIIIPAMARYDIPQNVGKVRVAMFLGNKFAVWNGKQGKHEFRILCRSRAQAIEVAAKINKRDHNGTIEVMLG